MAKFMDVHEGMVGITPEALLAAHQGDLAIRPMRGWTSSTRGPIRSAARSSACPRPRAPRLSRGSTPATASRPPEIHELTMEV